MTRSSLFLLRAAVIASCASNVSPTAASLPRSTRAMTIAASEAPSYSPALDAPPAPTADPFPARTYGDLAADACLGALDERAIPYERIPRAHGIDAPVRLVGALHGVELRHAGPHADRSQPVREIMDCRLLLALDDLAGHLAPRGIVAIVHFGVYRGDLPLPRRGPPLHHVAALAIDVGGFTDETGTRLEIARDWSRRLGPRTCDDADAPAPGAPEKAVALRSITCEIVGAKLFQEVLTPNHDARHRDHLHLEVVRGSARMMVE